MEITSQRIVDVTIFTIHHGKNKGNDYAEKTKVHRPIK